MQIRPFYGSKSLGVFLLYDLGDEKAPVCEIWCFYHNPNTLVDFWTLAPLLNKTRQMFCCKGENMGSWSEVKNNTVN